MLELDETTSGIRINLMCKVTMLVLQAIQERHENSLLRREMNRLREENKALREIVAKGACLNCGVLASAKDSIIPSEFQQLRIENARLKSEVS